MQVTSQTSPSFLKSKTAEGLVNLMRVNNIKRKIWFNYQINFANGYFYAWFHVELEQTIKEELDGTVNRNT
jgi:hypothetical protein